ncbi:GNAT family N-acetyltransferase [Actinopolyspora mortivallis]|uniref:GNAT family N-acetyltransferase n=1 Tax=Actinopolyspora mortivallis TaxID=33906 RepID=UPI000364F214|nr:GNAT family N-acetyltransferase [Actinopolyspora mortivallis]
MNIRELDRAEARIAHPVLRELRPWLDSPEDFLAAVSPQFDQGYRLACVFDTGPEARAAVGFRVGDTLAWGRHLYVDDLCTLPEARGNGYATGLLGWVEREAVRLGVRQLHLDSGTQRHTAHRLYTGNGFTISSLHFTKTLDEAVTEPERN